METARQETSEASERSAAAAKLGIDQQSPIAGLAEFFQKAVRDLAVFVERRAGIAPLDDFNGFLHHRVARAPCQGRVGGLNNDNGILASQMRDAPGY